MNDPNKELSPEEREALLKTLQARFEKNMSRHPGVEWALVQAKLAADAEKLWSLSEMERTGGEPDVVGQEEKTGEIIFYDCSAETPAGPQETSVMTMTALEARKEHKPAGHSAMNMAASMGIELLTEEEYQRPCSSLANSI